VARIIRGKWQSFNNPVAVGLDATKFDMHVSEGMLRWEHSVYERIYSGVGGELSELRKLLKWQRHNKGRGRCEDGSLTYSVKGKRASGDMNTALGNCIIMCALVHAYARDREVPVKLVNNGDDCVVFMEAEHLAQFSVDLDKWFLEMGFRMTVEPPVYELERIEFCQMHPIVTGAGWNMVRNIGTALVKDTMCTMPLDAKSARKWMYAVGECGLALTTGVPIMQAFYQAYMRNGNPNSNIGNAVAMASGLRMMRRELASKVTPVSDEARLSVFVAWGITPEEQIALETYYDSWSFTGQVDIDAVSNSPFIANVV